MKKLLPILLFSMIGTSPLYAAQESSSDTLFQQGEKPMYGYQITENDIKLISQGPPAKIRKFETYDGSTLNIPEYQMRNFVRTGILPEGIPWTVYFEEITPNNFRILGTNSLGQKIQVKCGKLHDCFPLI